MYKIEVVIMKKIFFSILLIAAVFYQRTGYSLSSFGIKTWTHMGGWHLYSNEDIIEPLGDETADLDFAEGTDGDLFTALDIGPSYTYYFTKKTSMSVNLMFTLLFSDYELYTDKGLGDDSDGLYGRTVSDNMFRGELFTTLNHRIANFLTGFIGFKYNTSFLSGNYTLVSDSGTEVSDDTNCFLVNESYGGGGGLATNFHTFGNLYLLSSFSYIYMYTTSTFSYGQEEEEGYYFSHEPMVKLSFAYFFVPIKSTVEIGWQAKYKQYHNVLGSSAERFDVLDGCYDIEMGPILNFTRVF